MMNAKTRLPFRQIHLDFHTSPDIPGVAKDFDPEAFAETLRRAHVNSITCFARCHHGMLYYDSKRFPERVHPHLQNRNLLGEQIEIGHKYGIRVPVYITVQWDHYTATEHPEWLAIDGEGRIQGTPPFEAGFYRHLCVNTPYRDFLKAQTEEVLQMFDVDGIFFDIVKVEECACKYCREGMLKAGLDPDRKADRLRYAQQMMDDFKRDMTAFVRSLNSECDIFYNQGHVGPAERETAEAYTHFELESLPSGHWGYLHFPIVMRYARTLGLDCVTHTGKFHTAWGDFHSFKNKEALEFECYSMLALNSKCLVGDQLEPNGRLSNPVYELIGAVYSEVEKKEPWCEDAVALTDIGVFTPEEFIGASSQYMPPDIIGVTRILQESGHQFDILDSHSDLSNYKVLVLPDRITVNESFARKLREFLSNGGSIIASYESGLNPEKSHFMPEFGLELVGPAPYSPDFLIPSEIIGKKLPKTEHVMYLRGLEVKPVRAEVLAEVAVPYFNRTWQHFCSHLHTPSSGRIGYPGVLRSGRVIYFAHPIFRQYDKNAPRWVKQVFLDALNLVLPEPLVRHNGPSTMMITLNQQTDKNRDILHLLHYIPERRSKDIDVINDVIPLYDVAVSIRDRGTVQSVTCVPEGVNLPFRQENGRVLFTVPRVEAHQMICLQY
ncbi:alpha-amylase family protein [Alicyclobacillus herbarius]|uniref:alpha-amylase family protein n=1 Tax=Alicyclobacillus herbarius TaxID=122960 RepID=UPI0023562888|nr:beta-galactosidase trimerization domain-containing protein [Alicyclobacillus herbarius]